MDSDEKYLYLLEDVQSKILLLERAVDEIGSVKKSLKTTAADVKAQIRDSISRHLEALRNRETWLLSQVEVLQHGKEDVLRQQHAELNQAVGSLKNTLSLLQQKGTKVTDLEERLMQTIQAVEKLDLVPEESSCIGFRALNLELLEHIRRFGVVGVDDALNVSFKEMTLSESAATEQGRKRKYFAPTGPATDWLLNGGYLHRSLSMPGEISSDAQEYATIAKWLEGCQINDTKSLSASASDTGKEDLQCWLRSENSFREAVTTNSNVFTGFIEELNSSAPGLWVKCGPKVAPKVQPVCEISETYSRIAAMGPEHWLSYKQRQNDRRSMAEVLQELQEIRDASPDMWLKREIRQAPVESHGSTIGQAYGKIAATSAENWLRPKPNCEKVIACADCECLSVPSCSSAIGDTESIGNTAESMDDSDWLTVKKADVISIENLDSIFQLRQTKPLPDKEKANWLLKTALTPGSSTDDGCETKADNTMHTTSNDSWLISSTPTNTAEQTNSSGFKEFIQSLQHTKWLVRPQPSAEICQWLARSSVDTCKECPKMCSKDLFTVFCNRDGTDGWLLK